MFGRNKIPQSLNQWKGIRKMFLWSSAVPELLRCAASPPRAPSLSVPVLVRAKHYPASPQAGRSAGDSQRRMPWWIPHGPWSMIVDTPQSLCIPFLTDQCLALELRIYPARCSRSSEPPWFSQSLWLAHFTLLLLELLLSVSKEPSFAFPGQQHHLEPPLTCAAPICPREQLPATAEKNKRQK